ncbi:hypothetical protein B0H13DRAFT_1996990 [Mycena leptocephala]|nr:hypothetical protein B0H13DRAFT_1996990 [Mycena leptocephala]
MSWQHYVDKRLVKNPEEQDKVNITKAAILNGADPNPKVPLGYTVRLRSILAVSAAQNRPAFRRRTGRYQRRVQGPCKSRWRQILHHASGRPEHIREERGASIFAIADGFVIAKTKTAILVAEYAAPAQAPEAVVVVEGVADWLRTAGS